MHNHMSSFRSGLELSRTDLIPLLHSTCRKPESRCTPDHITLAWKTPTIISFLRLLPICTPVRLDNKLKPPCRCGSRLCKSNGAILDCDFKFLLAWVAGSVDTLLRIFNMALPDFLCMRKNHQQRNGPAGDRPRQTDGVTNEINRIVREVHGHTCNYNGSSPNGRNKGKCRTSLVKYQQSVGRRDKDIDRSERPFPAHRTIPKAF